MDNVFLKVEVGDESGVVRLLFMDSAKGRSGRSSDVGPAIRLGIDQALQELMPLEAERLAAARMERMDRLSAFLKPWSTG